MGGSLCFEDKSLVSLQKTVLYSNKNVKNFLAKYPNLQSNLIINTKLFINLNQFEEKNIQSALIFRQNTPNAFGLYNGILFQENIEINNEIQAWVYQGKFKKFQKHGEGSIIINNGDYYIGQWNQDFFDGKGKYKSVSPFYQYQGQWRRGKKQGMGKIVFGQKDQRFVYQGSFYKDEMHGQGKIIYNDHSQYEGELKNNFLHGKGVYITSSFKYQGQWVKGFMQGVGSCQWYNQNKIIISVYYGEFFRGQKHGIGQYTDLKNGKKFKGQWNYGKIHLQNGVFIQQKNNN